MNFPMVEEDMNKLLDVAGQLKLFSEMACQAKEVTLTREGLEAFLRRLSEELEGVAEAADVRRSLGNKSSIRPHMLAQIIATVSGQRPILGRDMNSITLKLRECAAADEEMRPASDAWEKLVTAEGGPPITTCEGFLIQFHQVQALLMSIAQEQAGET